MKEKVASIIDIDKKIKNYTFFYKKKKTNTKITLYHVNHTDFKLNSITNKNGTVAFSWEQFLSFSRCEETTATRFILTSPT